MREFICFVAFLSFGALTNGQLSGNYSTEEFITLNRYKHEQTLQNMTNFIEKLRQNGNTTLKVISLKEQMFVDEINDANEKYNQLQVLNDLNKRCVSLYRQLLPSTKNISSKIDICIASARSNFLSLLINPVNTRRNLENYYQNTFEKNIVNCYVNYQKDNSKYVICVTEVVRDADSYTNKIETTFSTQINLAQCSSLSYTKDSLSCSYNIGKHVLSSISKVNSLISQCGTGVDNCAECAKGYTCSEVVQMKSSSIAYNDVYIPNPFYHRYTPTNCLMVQLV